MVIKMSYYSDPLMNELVRSRVNMRRKIKENSDLRKQLAQLRAVLRRKTKEELK